ncbi:MAG: histidine phosphatase family protein [Rhodoferax sp.]|nr:histidine phosphatase family protein [Rhodoferax sp.]
MGTLYLVRHGQASFGAEDYDQLSDLGARQSERLGQYLAGKGLTFDAALCGTLRRQVDTCGGILRAGGYPLEAEHWPGLNEFDGEAIIATVHPHPLERTDSPERYREHFRLLRDGLRQWMNGVVSPKGMPTYQEFRQGVVDVLDHIRKHHEGNVLLVSSGGPISTAVGHVLATSPETTIELNLRIRNSSVTEFEFNPKRHTLVTYNTLPHLDTPELASWITYS